MKPKQKSLSVLASELALIHASYSAQACDMAAWHAPSECFEDNSRYEEKAIGKFEKRNRIKVETVMKRITARTSGRWAYFGFQNLVSRLHDQRCIIHGSR